ncbi:MAG: DUF4251 domain-containing protein [Salinimicrobium sp.]
MKSIAYNFLNRPLKRLFLLLFSSSLLLVYSCGSSRGSNDKITEYDDLQQLVSSREFAVENQWLQPLTGSRVNLIGNTNYMRFKNDSVKVFLPYYGERHSGGAYDREGGITYEGPLQNLEIEENPDAGRIKMSFEGRHDSENLWFTLIMFPNGKVDTSVRSSQRNSISYDGELEPLPEKYK